jgi:hypothetical protein
LVSIAQRLELGSHEFAFHFQTKEGVEADALGNFLKRAATVARQSGAELRVVGLREGSLAVIIEAIRKSRAGKGAAKEFSDKPIDTTIKVSGFLASIVAAIAYAMSPAQSGSTPIAKAGADVIENHHVTEITLVTNRTSIVVMNQTIAAEVREKERFSPRMLPESDEARRLPGPMVEMIEDARQGNLSGEAAIVNGELHFRPDGYRYWVPVDGYRASQGLLYPGGHFRVAGQIEMRHGQPDRIIVDAAKPI